MKKWLSFFLLCLLLPAGSRSWGFYAHQQINRLAVFTLPPDMIGFYKQHLGYLADNAVNPDKRRYVVPAEAPRHYIDLDAYGDSAAFKLPRNWTDALLRYGADSLHRHGIVPWHLSLVKYQLTEAFRQHNVDAILRLSADLGHYVADACVPLHTTRNYNGQLTGQHGIHGLWESRLPELWASQYDFLTGPAGYLPRPQQTAWEIVKRSHAALDSVFRFEKETAAAFSPDRKYTFETRGGTIVKAYSREYAHTYHRKLAGQVERQMRYAIWLVGSFWYTCWVDAGQPELRGMQPLTAEQQAALVKEKEQLKAVTAPGPDREAE